MSYDAIAAFTTAKNAYARERGAKQATGIYYASKVIPKTTYGDVITFGTLFLNATSTKECQRLVREKGLTMQTLPEYNACSFTKTTSFIRALNRWIQYFPWSRDTGWALRLKEEYPWNEEFWAHGLGYATARGGAGAVPGKFEMAMSSISEAIRELPGVPAQLLNQIPNLPGLPNLTSMAEIIKWGSIGGALYILYKYVLAPKKS